MDAEKKTAEMMERVTRRQIMAKYDRAVNEAKRERQRHERTDQRSGGEIMADALMALYRAGIYDALITIGQDPEEEPEQGEQDGKD